LLLRLFKLAAEQFAASSEAPRKRLLQIAKPPKVATAVSEIAVPTAHGIRDDDDREPNEINNRQTQAIVRREKLACSAE